MVPRDLNHSYVFFNPGRAAKIRIETSNKRKATNHRHERGSKHVFVSAILGFSDKRFYPTGLSTKREVDRTWGRIFNADGLA